MYLAAVIVSLNRQSPIVPFCSIAFKPSRSVDIWAPVSPHLLDILTNAAPCCGIVALNSHLKISFDSNRQPCGNGPTPNASVSDPLSTLASGEAKRYNRQSV
jgi:hypothetical protein